MNVQVLVMAGGRGRRLDPLTAFLPKPLVPVGDRPILEHVLAGLSRHGVAEATLAVGHLAALVEAYFGDGRRFGLRLRYLREERPLGTAGAVGLLAPFDGPLFVTNADILTDLELPAMLDRHRRAGAAATVAAVETRGRQPTAVIETDAEGRIVGYAEKPEFTRQVAIGSYLLEAPVRTRIARDVAEDRPIDMPDVIQRLLADGLPVHAYLHPGDWIDVGRPEDLARAQARVGFTPEEAP